jgi:peroxiredoxin
MAVVGVVAAIPPAATAPPAPPSAEPARTENTPAGTSAFAAFGAAPSSALVVPAFEDFQISQFIATLDRLLADERNPTRWPDHARDVLWQFSRRLQSGLLGQGQEARVLRHLGRIAAERPEAAPIIERSRRMIQQLSIGKVAPEIIGTDLEGRQFRLTDYRERVVALVFSAEWCAICKTQWPYERFLLEQYEGWPFVLLGVETGSTREAALQKQIDSRLPHRAWWDEPGEGAPNGQIAADWHVIGWPATYLIDGDGVIRFVDPRQEDLLRGVRQLVDEQVDRDARRRR